MAVQNIPANSKLIFSKILLNKMYKEKPSIDEIVKSSEIEVNKEKLRDSYSEIQEKFVADQLESNTLKDEMRLYNFKMLKLELSLHEVLSEINKKKLYYHRLEVLYNLINNDPKETFVEYDDLFSQLLESIKDEAVNELETKLNILRLTLQANVYSKELSREDENKYRDQLYDVQTELKELKKVLKIDKLNELKGISLDKLANDSSTSLLNNLYQNELYSNMTR